MVSWWSVDGQCGGQCDDARLMVSWWSVDGQLMVSVMVSVTMHG